MPADSRKPNGGKVEPKIAKATYSPILTNLQGALGPVTFVKTPYGPVARPTVLDPVQPNSASQQAAKNRVRRVAAFWNGLTASQRIAWNSAALLVRKVEEGSKKSYRPTGYNLYSSYANVWLQAHGDAGTPPVAPPSGSYAGSSVAITATASAGKITFSASSLPDSGTLVEIWTQPLRSASRKPAKGGYRVAAYATFATGVGGATYQLTVPAGAYAAGYSFVETATGRRTSRVEIPVTGVALALEEGGAEAAPASRKKAA